MRDANKIGLDKGFISKETFLINQLRYALFECWDINDSEVNSWISTFEELVENKIVKNIETCIDIVEHDRYFNRYEDVDSYSSLAGELLNDDCLWEDDDSEEERNYLEENRDNEPIIKKHLLKGGWYVSSEDMAIGLDDETLTNEFLSARKNMEEINREIESTKKDISWSDDDRTISILEEKLENLNTELSDIENKFSI